MDAPPPFVPHPLLRGFHRQTLVAALLRGERWRPQPPSEPLVVTVDVETRLLLRASWQARADAPVCVLVHGLGGSADSAYMLGTARKAYAAGFHVVRMNLRGAGEGATLAARPYHSGITGDMAAVLAFLASRRRGPCVVAGFSLGGNVVLRLAGLEGAAFASRVVALAAVSPAVDLSACADALDGDPAARLYRDAFVRELLAMARGFAERGTGRRELAALGRPRTLRAFDHGWTAPIHGFASAEDYYRQASALSLLPRIAVPTLVIQAADDRLVPAAPLATLALPDTSPLQRMVVEHGGHCAFIAAHRSLQAGRPDVDRMWAENRVVRFLADAVGLAPGG